MREGLRKYLNCYGSFEMQYVTTSPVHAYLVNGYLKCHLFRNVVDLANGFTVCKHIWMNDNQTIRKLQLQPGDIVQLEATAEGFKQGTEYHRLNTTRGNVKTFRLLYPRRAKVVRHEELFLDQILNLKTKTIYNTFDDYIQGLNYRVHYEDYWLHYIHLFDNQYKENLFNRLRKCY